MPEEDGLTFIAERRARGDEREGAIPAVALTASASSEDRDRALLAGFDRYLTKPVEVSKLCAAIGELCTRRPGRTWPRR
jgi:CheY-like chemotaxis protein